MLVNEELVGANCSHSNTPSSLTSSCRRLSSTRATS
jgi:hypothetical protein